MSRRRGRSHREEQAPAHEPRNASTSSAHEADSPPPVLSSDERVLHRKHGVALFWTVIGGLITAIASQYYQQVRPPQQVILANADTITRTLRHPDSVTSHYMAEMVDELRRIRSSTAGITQQGVSRPARGVAAVSDIVNLPILEPFRLPPQTKGWIAEPINAFAIYTCPDSVTRPSAELSVAISLRNRAIVSSLSPIEFGVNRPESATSTWEVFHAQYELLPDNRILFTAPHDTGQYKVEFGFFARADVSRAYPLRYGATCSLHVVI